MVESADYSSGQQNDQADDYRSKPAQLTPSELGTKEYWDALYTRELSNHAVDPGDEGTIWFDDNSAEEKMLEMLGDLDLGIPGIDTTGNPNVGVLDLGTGNGHFLFALKDEGWQARMVGVDYSELSIQLARNIQEARQAESKADEDNEGDLEFQRSDERIEFLQWDILSSNEPSSLFSRKFDIIVDKGTFDAVSLKAEDVKANRLQSRSSAIEVYVQRVRNLLRPGGHFLIVSCNWTESEVRSWFENAVLQYQKSIAFPRFRFGGVEGQSVSGVCLRMKKDQK